MAHDKFPLIIKSTVDYLAGLLATEVGVPFIDLDGAELSAGLLETDQSALAWSLATLSEDPRDPLWTMEFEIGAKTSNDPSQYTSLDLVSLVRKQFYVGAVMDVMDYTGTAAPTVKAGKLIISSVATAPQQFDRTSGLRLVSVTAKVMRL